MNVPLYRFIGEKPGPKVYIQSSIHGAEVQGNVVIYHLIQRLKQMPICGEVILVPNCNPVGTNIKAGEYTLGRFDPVNGTNWNRGYFYDESLIQAFAQSVQDDDNNSPLTQILCLIYTMGQCRHGTFMCPNMRKARQAYLIFLMLF